MSDPHSIVWRFFGEFGIYAIILIVILGVMILNGIISVLNLIKQRIQQSDAWKRRIGTRAYILRHAGNIFDQQKTNHRMTVLLVSSFILYYLVIGYGTDVFLLKNDPLGPHGSLPIATLVSLLVAGGFAVYCYYDGDRLVLNSVVGGAAQDDEHGAQFMNWVWGVIVLVLIVLIVITGYTLFGRGSDLITPSYDPLGSLHRVFGYIPHVFLLAFILCLIVSAIAFYLSRSEYSDDQSGEGMIKRVLLDDPSYRQLVNVVNEIAIAAGIPTPSIYIVRDKDPNAFATGRDPQHASIVLTSGLLEHLDREELQAVVAHAIAHIRNYDIRLMTLLVTLGTGSILLVSAAGSLLGRGVEKLTLSRFMLLIPQMVIILPLWLGLVVFTSLIVRALRLVISDERVYQADVTAAELTRNPESIIRALKEIDDYVGPTRSFKAAIGPLCVVGPSGEYQRMDDAGFIFRFCMKAHPPMAKRIEALKAMGYVLGYKTSDVPPRNSNELAAS